MIKKITFLIFFVLISFSTINAQTTFGFDSGTQSSNGVDTVTETVDGITMTITGLPSHFIFDGMGVGGSTGNIVLCFAGTTSPITYTFSEPVTVNSILAFEGTVPNADIEYTFTPTGGSNSPVTTTLISDGANAAWATPNLNWTDVTSFTVEGPSGVSIIPSFENIIINGPLPATFSFDSGTQSSNGVDTVTETVDGITMTVTGLPSHFIFDGMGVGGSTGNIIICFAGTTSPITYTFSEPVTVNSILAFEGTVPNADIEYTFTPTGGSNSPVTTTLISDGANAAWATPNLNWTDVTSFTVEGPSGVSIIPSFENIVINDALLSNNKFDRVAEGLVYPNPVSDIVNIEKVKNLKTIDVYNTSGQKVMQTTYKTINLSSLSKGLYLLKINTEEGVITKKVIKN